MKIRRNDSEAARASTLARELRILLGTLRRRLRAEAHPEELTVSQMSVLGRLEREGPATVTTLARDDGVRPQSMSATVSALEAAGLLSGSPDPADGRQTLLSLTPAGKEMIRANRAAREDWLYRAVRTKLSAREQGELAVGVELLKRLVES